MLRLRFACVGVSAVRGVAPSRCRSPTATGVANLASGPGLPSIRLLRPMLLLLAFGCVAGPTDDVGDSAREVEPCSGVLYEDADDDGFGAAEVACDAPGAVRNGGDCDDADPEVGPTVEERCNGRDDDCDGEVEAPAQTWYADADGDGFGDPAATVEDCEQPVQTVANADDCDDADARTYPAAAELCDLLDNDCDGAIEEAGIVSFESEAGEWEDLAEDMAPGTRGYGLVSPASAGTVWICGGTHRAVFDLDEDVAIRGRPELGSATVNAAGAPYGVSVNEERVVTLENLVLTGSTWSGVFVSDDADVTLDTVEIAAVTSSTNGAAILVGDGAVLEATGLYVHDTESGGVLGGAVYAEGATRVTIEGSVFEDNVALGAGGAISVRRASLSVSDSRFARNVSRSEGGAIGATSGAVVIDGCTFEDSAAGAQGGTVYADAGLRLEASTVSGSTSGGGGGCVYVGGTGTFQDATLERCATTGDGGGILMHSFSARLVRTVVAESEATGAGGGLWFQLTALSIEDSVFRWNSAGEGGGIAQARGTLEATNLELSANTATGDGGGLITAANTTDAVLLTDARFLDNVAGGDGGGFSVAEDGGSNESVTLTTTDFEGNIAVGVGGGVHVDNLVLDMVGGSFVANVAADGGGFAADPDGGAVATFDAVAFDANHADEGGGLAMWGGGGLALTNGTTFTDNTATTGGGIWLSGLGGTSSVTASCTDSTLSGNTALDAWVDFSAPVAYFEGDNCPIGSAEVGGVSVDLVSGASFSCDRNGCE